MMKEFDHLKYESNRILNGEQEIYKAARQLIRFFLRSDMNDAEKVNPVVVQWEDLISQDYFEDQFDGEALKFFDVLYEEFVSNPVHLSLPGGHTLQTYIVSSFDTRDDYSCEFEFSQKLYPLLKT